MLVGACYTEAEVRRQKDEQVGRQGFCPDVLHFWQRGFEKSFLSVPRNRDPDGEDSAGLGLS